MKSSPGLRIAVVATLCFQPFLACTGADTDYFTTPGDAGDASRAGSSSHAGSGAAIAGNAPVGSAGSPSNAGSIGASGDSGDAGMAGKGDTAGSGNGGVTNVAGQSGNAGLNGGAGRGGSSGAGGTAGSGNGGSAGRGGGGAGGKGGAGAGGAAAGAGGKGGAGVGGAGAGGKGGAGAGGAGAGGASAGGAGAGAGGAGAGGAGAGGAGAGGSAVCGNQVLEKGEQCDDGNTKSMDACSASCGFEQSHRANSIEQKFKTSSLCSKNAFGDAFEGDGQAALQAILDQRVEDGSLSLLFAFRGLRDLSGMSAETITLGMAFGAPSAGPSYDGTSDLDWWYTPATGQIDSSGALYSTTTAQLAAGVLDADPGSLRIPLLSDVPIDVSSAKLRLTVGDTSTPLTSAAKPPGHLASEHLRSTIVSFASAGAPPPGNGDPGQLCGNLSAASLSNVAIPARYVSGSSACSEDYAASNTFLDLLIGGCTVHGDEVVVGTQPDQVDPGAPVAGAGAPYRLIANANTLAVTVCRDKKDANVSLDKCLNAAAYSSAYRLNTGRVIIK